MWDFGSGQELKWKSGRGHNDDLAVSITGLQYCVVEGERCIVALGWGNRLRLFLVSDIAQEVTVP